MSRLDMGPNAAHMVAGPRTCYRDTMCTVVILRRPGHNWPLLMAYREHARLMAKRHLSRRSQKSYVGWSEFNRFCELHPLASPKRLTDLITLGRELSSRRDK